MFGTAYFAGGTAYFTGGTAYFAGVTAKYAVPLNKLLFFSYHYGINQYKNYKFRKGEEIMTGGRSANQYHVLL